MKTGIILISIIILIILGSFIFIKTEKNEKEFIGKMKLISPAFNEGEEIPIKYTCNGQDINPELIIEGVPENTESLVLIVDDPDAPFGTFTHWVLFNIPATIRKIKENSIPQGSKEGKNDFNKINYGGPCPPSGIHRYRFKLYALDTTLNLKEGASKQEVENAMKGHILEKTVLIGKYKKE